MKVLITGGTGFLGSHLTRFLKDQGHLVTSFGTRECDLTNAAALNQYNAEKWDAIYHLAAWTQAGTFCLHHPGEQWLMNQAINTNVLSWWAKFQPQAKLVAMGTSCSYEPGTPHVEENYLKGDPIESLYTYGMTKRMLLVGLQALHKQFGLEYLYAIPSTLYGPGYHTDGRQRHFIFDLLAKIVSGKEHGTPVVLWGDGHQKRELVHVGDFVRALSQLASNAKNDLFNIGGGEEFSIRWFANELCSIVGYDSARIQYDETQHVGARSKHLIVDKAKQALGPHFKWTPIATGFREIVDWYAGSNKTQH